MDTIPNIYSPLDSTLINVSDNDQLSLNLILAIHFYAEFQVILIILFPTYTLYS